MRADELGVPPINRASLEASQRPFDAIARQARHVILSCLYRLHIDGNLTGNFHAEVDRATRHVRGVGTRHQCLCRRAAGVDASPTKEFSLDNGNSVPCVRKTMSKRWTCLSSSDDNCIVALHRMTHRLCDTARYSAASIISTLGSCSSTPSCGSNLPSQGA